jgi:hypothetical protein
LKEYKGVDDVEEEEEGRFEGEEREFLPKMFIDVEAEEDDDDVEDECNILSSCDVSLYPT